MNKMTFILSSLIVVNAYSAKTFKEDFEKYDGSQWESGAYGQTGKSKWVIEKDEKQNSILSQKGYGVYQYIVRKDISVKNADLSLRFSINSGKEDPEAGLLWRFQDPKNYIYVRANTLENNIVLYRMIDGKKEIAKEVQAQVKAGVWHDFKISFRGSSIQVFFDSKEVISMKDSKILKAGKVGVWTTADTLSSFDDFVVEQK